MKVGVKIMPLKEILDTQGRDVEKIFKPHGKAIEQVRVGRFVELDLPTANKDEALKKAKEMADFVLCNPLIESYQLEVL